MKNILRIEIGSNRVYGLDILRCVAILFVVIYHGNFLLPKNIATPLNYLMFDGVSLFFVLSGFLIGGILIKLLEKDGFSFSTLLSFWTRRWFRTLPNYFFVLILLTVLHLLFKEGFTLLSVKRFFFFAQNLFYNNPVWFFPEAWSLSVEEWFYLIIPIFIFVLARFGDTRKSIIYTAVGILLFVTLFRLYRYLNVPVHSVKEWDLLFRKQVITQLDSLMYGVIGAYIAYHHKEIWLRYKYILLLMGIVLLLSSKIVTPEVGLGLYFCVFSFSVSSIGTLFLLPFLSSVKQGKGWLFKAVTTISLISYSMYLLNLSFIQKQVLDRIDLSFLPVHDAYIKYPLFWILTTVLSILLYKYFEMPMTKLRDKTKPRA